MGVIYKGWKNKNRTTDRACKCGTWKNHWINYSGKDWPTTCSVEGCTNKPTLGAHVYNSEVSGEKIIPACNSCNQLEKPFNIKIGTQFVSANKNETCEK